ncbi:hypothetical protein L486_07632 [Kwoniella mangroviensis CBS 10435]|uniref:Galactose oxidase n=1 Tax=Kwoniella mangroviensis CBS 10435 TaxID=1331196 RepID=A0A1B9IH79_9TREE|nr:hypothetical protein L486_07632 [Kwoniella mangroviensis CBS 10435]
MDNIIQHGRKIALLVLISTAQSAKAVDANNVTPRWGHAAAYIPSPPTLIIQGGKTDPSSSYTYSSSPNTGETLILPLTSSSSMSSAPFIPLDIPSAPTSAWHTLMPLSSEEEGIWKLLSFGGDGGTAEAVQTGSNSAWIMDVKTDGPNVNYTRQESGNGQPMRRIYHSASSTSEDGKVYITGGLKDDGSGATFSDAYSFDSSTSSFSPLPSLPIGLYHHSSIILPNGTLLALGGAYTSPSTGVAALQPYSTIYTLDTTSSSPSWTERQISGTVPEGRRGGSLVTNEDGTKAFLFGGANAGLGEVYGDSWEFDLADGTWKEVTTAGLGPQARYDHTAVGIGGNQIAVFGGYGDGGPADSNLHIWDTSTSSWITDFTPVPTSSTTTTSTASSGKSVDSSGISTSHIIGTKTQSASGSAYTPSASATASSSSTSAPTDAGAHSHPLTLPIKIGLILGILAVVALLVALCLWRCLRRRHTKQAALLASPWPASGPKGRTPPRPYGSREKGGEGLMEELSPENSIEGGYEAWGLREKGASIGLGMGAIGATLHSISSKFSGKKDDPYAELHDDSSDEVGGPLRKSSRRIGDGIRLLGLRPQREKSLYYSPEKPARRASIIRNSRIDMLGGEDMPNHAAGTSSRNVEGEDEDEDWVIDSDESGRNWKSAKSLLNNRQSDDEDQDPFHDRASSFDDDAPILPPLRVRGGPVPTPHESRSDLGTLDEIASMSNPYSELSRNAHSELSRNPYSDVSRNRLSHNSSLEYHLPSLSPSDPLDLTGLLVPPSDNRYSQTSIPTSARSGRSGRSGQSNALSDAEEGIISEARYLHSQSPTLISPVETAYVPIKRSESFFRRMAAGGIISLLSSTKSISSSSQGKELDIRDPAPQPTLWPVMSSENVNSPSSPSPISPESSNHPPKSWRGDTLDLPSNEHGKGPSLSSLNSAKSMRDMVLVQRETTTSSVGSEAVIEMERASSPVDQTRTQVHRKDESDGTLVRAEESDSLSPLPSETSTSVIPLRPDGAGHRRDGNSQTTFSSGESGLDTPGEIVFNGADFASPPVLPTHQFGSTPSAVENDQTPRKSSLRPTPYPITPRRAISKTLNTTVIDESYLPPSGSPVPTPLVQHRRPVRDVVNSINKRGSSTPFSLLSPMSNYSPAIDRKSSLSSNIIESSVVMPTKPKSTFSGQGEGEDQDPFGTPRPRLSSSKIQRPVTIHGSSDAGSSSTMSQRVSSSSVDKRPTTMWEVIKKEQLRVANPDQNQQRNFSGIDK